MRNSTACVAVLATVASTVAGPLALAQSVPGPERTGNLGPVLQHNPIFGLGPQTIWRGGFGIQLETEFTSRTGDLEERGQAVHAEFLYGITADLNIALAVPIVARRSERGIAPGLGQVDRDATGLGDAIVRAKWRFFHRFSGRKQYHAAIIGGIKLPLASAGSDPPLGAGSTDFLAGITVSRDALRSYLWTSALVRVNGEAFNRKRGNEYRYDAAVGIRPWIPRFTGLDALFLVELNAVTAAENVIGGVEQSETGGTVLAVSPGFWLTYRNWALKGGIKLPVFQDLGATQPRFDYALIVSIETHM